MSISIKKNVRPKLPICEMLCDGGLDPKLNLYDVTKFMNEHATNLFLGRPRSGKTSFLYSIFKQKKLFARVYHNIYIFQPSASRASMKDQLFNQLPEDQLYEELTYDNLSECIQRIKNAPFEENHCIIFDDMTAYLKNKATLQMLKELIYNRRHLHCSIFFLVQTWYSVPKDIRKLFSNLFIFKTGKCEMESLFDEIVEQHREIIPTISKIAFSEKYNFLFINTESGRMFKNFDEIIIKNGEDIDTNNILTNSIDGDDKK